MNYMLQKCLYMTRNRLVPLFVSLTICCSCACSRDRNLPDVEPLAVQRYISGLSMNSKLLGTLVKYDIMLPADYGKDAGKRYPVIYCFHGYGDDNTSWNGSWMSCEAKIKSLEKNHGLEQMIYVFPNGWKTYWVNRFDGTFPYMDMLAEEFVPMIDQTYRTLADRGHRGLIGYSMGGFGAMACAMQHPELFSMSAPLSMSFRTDEQYMSESQSGWDNQWGKVFGGVGQSGNARLTSYYKSLCPLHQFTPENREKYSSVHWFLTCGDNEEQLLIANDDLHVMMRNNGYPHEYRVWDGGHSASYWRAALEEVLPYFSAMMAGESSWQMTLKEVDAGQGLVADAEGVYVSQGYKEAGDGTGTALYIVFKQLDKDILDDVAAILGRGMSAKKCLLLPCDLGRKSLGEWMSYYQDIYPCSARQALALGMAGEEVIKRQERFTALYFENANLSQTAVTIDVNKFYYIGQCDEGEHYAGANELYKACKKSGASFEYRCRNHLDDERVDLLTGIEYVKSSLHNF